MTIKIVNKRGLKCFVTRNKLRVGVVVGAFLSLLLTVYLAGGVWDVEIEEKDGVNVEAFTETLGELGVKAGARKSEVDILWVQDELLKRHEELLWVSLNIFGGRAELEYTLVNEKTPSPETNYPVNIVSRKKGVVTLVECYQGTPLVKEGQQVVEGSMLISGVVKNADGTETLTQGMGKVFAKTENTHKVMAESEGKVMISCDMEPKYGVFIFGLEIPFGGASYNGPSSVTKMPFIGNKIKLPVGFMRCDYLSLCQEEISVEDDLVRLSLLLRGVEQKRREYSSAKLRKVGFACDVINGVQTVTVKITCIEDISEAKTISVEKN